MTAAKPVRRSAAYGVLSAWLLLGVCWLPAALAAQPVWAELSSAQKALISPALNNQTQAFDKLPEARRAQLLKGAEHWLGMSPEQRQQAAQALAEWQAMSPKERDAALAQRKAFRKLPLPEQQALLARQRAFAQLSPAEQALERERFAAEQRKQERPSLPQRPELPMPSPPPLPGGLRR